MWKSFVMNQGSEGVREGVVKQSKARRGLERRGYVLLLEKYCIASFSPLPSLSQLPDLDFLPDSEGKATMQCSCNGHQWGKPSPTHSPLRLPLSPTQEAPVSFSP